MDDVARGTVIVDEESGAVLALPGVLQCGDEAAVWGGEWPSEPALEGCAVGSFVVSGEQVKSDELKVMSDECKVNEVSGGGDC